MDTILATCDRAGMLTDLTIDDRIKAAMAFQPTDVFIFAWGWDTTSDQQAAQTAEYINGLGEAWAQIGDGPQAEKPLNIGLIWPSTIHGDPFTYFSDLRLADQVGRQAGYALMRMIYQFNAGDMPRIHWIGHSMGCRIAASALATIEKSDPWAIGPGNTAVLLEAAFNNDALDDGRDYELAVIQTRIMVTRNQLDRACGEWYPAAERLANLFSDPTPAMGFTGPAAGESFPPEFELVDYQDEYPDASDNIVVDLTAMTQADGFKIDPLAGAHDDIYQPALWRLIARWIGRK